MTKAQPKPNVLLLNIKARRASSIRRTLAAFEYPLVAQITDVAELIGQCQRCRPDLLAVVIDKPNASVIRTLSALNKEYPLPVVMFVEEGSPKLIQSAVAAGVHAFIVADVESQRIPSILTVALARFHAQQDLVDELALTKAKLAERKTVDRAKTLLIKTRHMSETEAHRTLQKMAMDNGLSIATVSLTIIDALSLEAH